MASCGNACLRAPEEFFADCSIQLALYGYYFLLSFGAEVDLMWKREFSRGTMVFLAVRYLTLMNNCVAVAAISLYTVDQMVRRACMLPSE